MERKTLEINKLTSLQQDDDYKKYDAVQSMSKNKHVLTDFYTLHPEPIDNATDQVFLNFSKGHGIDKDVIDQEDKVGKVNNFRGDANQLFPRPYLTIPYTGNGTYDVDAHSDIRSYNISGDDRACNSLSGVTIEQQYTPLVPHLKDNIQNPQNLIPEDSKSDWFRGGIDTTQIRKDIDFFERCLDDKKVQDILKEKKPYLTNKPVLLTEN